MAKLRIPKPPVKPKEEKPPRWYEMAAFLIGILLFMLSLGLLGNEARSISWRYRARNSYTEGVARLVKTDIILREGVYDVEMTFRLEWNGRVGRETPRLDEDDPSASTLEDAQQRVRKLEIGKLYPCWYLPSDPENFNYFVPEGLQIEKAWLRLRWPLPVLLGAVLLLRWSWGRLKHCTVSPEET